MLDASNPAEAKAKKNKPTNQQRPVQRFWPENIANMQRQLEEQEDSERNVSARGGRRRGGDI